MKKNNFHIRSTFAIIYSTRDNARNDQEKKERKAHTPGLQIAMNEFAYVFFPICLTHIHPVLILWRQTSKASAKIEYVRLFLFIYFSYFLLRLLHTYLLTLSMFFTPWIIYEKYVAFSYFHSLTVTYPYWRYVPMYHSVKVICKCVTDTNRKISLCKLHIRSTSR